MNKYRQLIAGLICGAGFLLSGCGDQDSSGDLQIIYEGVGNLFTSEQMTITTSPVIKGLSGLVVELKPLGIQPPATLWRGHLPSQKYTITGKLSNHSFPSCIFIANFDTTISHSVIIHSYDNGGNRRLVNFNFFCDGLYNHLNISALNAKDSIRVNLSAKNKTSQLVTNKQDQVTLTRQNGYNQTIKQHANTDTELQVSPLVDSRDYVAQFNAKITSNKKQNIVIKYRATKHKMIAVNSVNSSTQLINQIINQHYNVIEWQGADKFKNNTNIMANWQNKLSNLTVQSLLWVNDKDSITDISTAPVTGYVINVTNMQHALALYKEIHQNNPKATLVLNITKPLSKAHQFELKSWYQQVTTDHKWNGWLQITPPKVNQKPDNNYHALLTAGISKHDIVVDMQSTVPLNKKNYYFNTLLKQYRTLQVKGLLITPKQIKDNGRLRNIVFNPNPNEGS